MSEDAFAYLRKLTAARIGLGRIGVSLPMRRVLEFQMAHALARDAVHARLDAERLTRELADLAPVGVESRAVDRRAYLERPDEGRKLSDISRQKLAGRFDVALVLADGLSARAANEHGAALVRALRSARPDWRWSPPVLANRARVALGDEIAAALGAELVVMLIGERPGLSSPDSLGAYLTFAPVAGVTSDAERNCVSNIRPAGLPIDRAVAKIIALATLARARRLTGIGLKEDEALAIFVRGARALEKDR